MKHFIYAMLAVVLYAAAASADEAARLMWRPDEFITTKIQIGLQSMAGINPQTVAVESREGQVTLSGTVPTAEDRVRVIDMAREVEGVKGVQDALKVAPDTTQARAAAGTRADDAIQKDIVNKLSGDPELRGSEIGVTVKDKGNVVLNGFATSLDDELRALRLTRSVDGVASIHNEMKSPPDTLHDIKLGSGSAPFGADVRNRQEREAAEGVAAEKPAGDAPIVPPESGTEQNAESHTAH